MENRIKQIKIETNDDEKDEILAWDKLANEEKNFVVNSMQQGANFFGRFLDK